MKRTAIFGLLVTIAAAPSAEAAIVPNPGTSTVNTNSTTATATYVVNSVTNTVNAFSTTIAAQLNGSPVFNATFALPFGDPTVQAAIAAADAVLAGDGTSYGAPFLASSATSSTSVFAAPVTPSLSCAQLSSGAYSANGTVIVTSSQMFGPATIATGNCQADTFTILPGQLDISVNSDIGFNVPVSAITTVTNTTTQLYDILGLVSAPTPVSVPEPGTAALALAGWGALALSRRRRHR